MPQRVGYSSRRTYRSHDAQESGFLAPRVVEKPWGREEWVAVTDSYAMKRLFIKAGHLLSIQYHPRKMESLVMVEGSCVLLLGEEGELDHGKACEYVFGIGDAVHINPRTVHTFKALTDCLIFEVSTPHLEDSDTVRIEDAYGRK